jgi:hypothetical protein
VPLICSTVGALLLGSMTNLAVHDSWQRHVTIVEAACSALTCAGNEGQSNDRMPHVMNVYCFPERASLSYIHVDVCGRMCTSVDVGDLPSVRLFICLSVGRSVGWSVGDIYICLSVCLSVCLSICLPVCLRWYVCVHHIWWHSIAAQRL